MSRFCGKCDFYDCLVIHDGFEKVINGDFEVFLGDRDHPLHFGSLGEVVPYYPHLVSSAAHDNVTGTATIFLTEHSYMDYYEEKYGKSEFTEYYRNQLAKEIAKYS